MKKDLFEQWDEAFMKDFKSFRERKVPQRILENFSASVERRIKNGTFPNVPGSVNPVHLEMFRSFRWVPAFAVLLLVVSIVVPRPAARPKLSQSESGIATPSIVSVSTSPEISEEVSFLEELGEWTDDDEADFN